MDPKHPRRSRAPSRPFSLHAAKVAPRNLSCPTRSFTLMSKTSTQETTPAHDVFADPVAYLAEFGIDAEVVFDTHGDGAVELPIAA